MYTIQQASLLVEIPASSIRYYEKIDLIPPIKRNTQDYRIFDDQDIELLKLIKCFRNLGMSIEDIRENISTLNLEQEEINTQAILVQHKKKLEEQIEVLNSYIHEIDGKIVT
ncbi:DNA-binding transcriptional MerR regulator [Psychrobacillus insolitus]|uniref:DNA-binding transcriptional MerR regulator n=1 Tax=Psychrobacillus insolitus TaxID=1461 RepID=A0A2W7MD47_9BACI|nr:MerR family transcriptional regulator [Psychrobacillus insolitus]PZX03152.1 DNA-binding transcriptional MerR regulator [Psychrobacillus insolitus]